MKKIFLLPLGLALLMPTRVFSGLHRFDPTNEAEIPPTLSATGIYADMAGKILIAEAVSYEVNAPLWSDGAYKERFLILAPGTHVGFNDSGDYYAYPDGAVFVKNFSLDTLRGKPLSRILWETRLLINQKKNGYDMWYGLSYKWRKDQTDADLVPDEGLDTAITGFYPGRTADGISAATKKWSFPKRNQCRLCHVSIAPGAFAPVQPGANAVRTRSVLGFFTAQLNKQVVVNGAPVNQLQALFRKGVFGASSQPKDFAELPRWRAIDDETASLEARARSYIASNCSGCHGTRGNLNGVVFGLSSVENALNYDYHDMAEHMDFKNKELSKDFGNGSRYLIWPGQTDKSTLWYRQSQRNLYDGKYGAALAQMPPLASYETDTVALKVIRRWIDAMPPATPDPSKAVILLNRPPAAEIPDALTALSVPIRAQHATCRNGAWYLPGGMGSGGNRPLTLISPNGKAQRILPRSDGGYPVPAGLAPGIYAAGLAGPRAPLTLVWMP